MNSKYELYHIDGELNHSYVAEVVGENLDLEDVFRLTNSIESSWWKNEEIRNLSGEVVERGGARSTSIFDRVYDTVTDKWYEVDVIGFIEVSADKIYAESESYAGVH